MKRFFAISLIVAALVGESICIKTKVEALKLNLGQSEISHSGSSTNLGRVLDNLKNHGLHSDIKLQKLAQADQSNLGKQQTLEDYTLLDDYTGSFCAIVDCTESFLDDFRNWYKILYNEAALTNYEASFITDTEYSIGSFTQQDFDLAHTLYYSGYTVSEFKEYLIELAQTEMDSYFNSI
ncbi:UNKNOWN [Stylonychia lemnae]|uniref:Uncharacterized protein n=1 Tax=Stylonychia lemnae TaxID=5949 RepID=A0A078AJ44_STYLE|nr:UNKNOWN [Stylonychia lemnae]|eukprot:CDW82244.1 UNKNOWN [Stylonychia lemnae]